MRHVDRSVYGISDVRAGIASMIVQSPFQVYGIIDASRGAPSLGDSHVVDGVLDSVGVVYGNALIGRSLQVVTEPIGRARSIDEFLDIETTTLNPLGEVVRIEPSTRESSGSCRIYIGGTAYSRDTTSDGAFWCTQIGLGAEMVTVVARNERPGELELVVINDLPMLVADRSAAIERQAREANLRSPMD